MLERNYVNTRNELSTESIHGENNSRNYLI